MLVEVRRELVKQDHQYLQKRFLQDAQQRVSIHIWQLPGDAEEEMLRFQIAWRELAFDWSADRGLYVAKFDEGENPMGMKRSPLLLVQSSADRREVEKLCDYLRQFPEKRSLQFICKVIAEGMLQNHAH